VEKMEHVEKMMAMAMQPPTSGYLLFGDAISDDILSNFDTDLGVPFSHTICYLVHPTSVSLA